MTWRNISHQAAKVTRISMLEEKHLFFFFFMILGKGDYISQVLGIINGGDYGKGSVYQHWYRQTSTDSHIVREEGRGGRNEGASMLF